jgi:hypothetical protein
LSEQPEVGKPLKYELKNHRSVRIKPSVSPNGLKK